MDRAPETVEAAARPAERHSRHVVWRVGGLSVRFERRTAVVHLVLVVALAAAALWALTLGDYGIPVGQVVAALRGHADDPLAAWFVTDVRLPRVTAAVLVGAALGVSGAIFQTISGNPLGSPDVIGFTTGSATGALVAIILVGASPAGTSLGAVVGGLVAALVVYLLSWRHGVAGFRLVLVGIGVGATLHAANALLVVEAPLDRAQSAAQWQAGSLNGVTWAQLAWLAVALAMLVPVAAAVSRGLSVLPLGDDLARSLGTRVQGARLVAVLVGVALVALATAVTGPIAFVALAAPHLVRRLTRNAGVALTGGALLGALLVLVSDVAAQRLFAPTQLAVGIVTGALGGTYLVALLALEWRRSRT